MATGYTAIYLTPDLGRMLIPDQWDTKYDTGETTVVDDDRFEWSDTLPDEEYPVGEGEWIVEVRELPDPDTLDGEGNPTVRFRVRIRGPVTVPLLRGRVVHLFTLRDERLPEGWNRAAVFWAVETLAANHKVLNEHIYTTLGYGPTAGAIAVQDPDDSTRFLDHAVRTFLDLTVQQNLVRLNNMITALLNMGYEATELLALKADALSGVPERVATATEDRLIRAIVADLGFTMAQLMRHI